MLQALRTLKVFFVHFSCNLMFGFPCDMNYLLGYIKCFWKSNIPQQRSKSLSGNNSINIMKKMFSNYYRRKTSKNIIFDLLWRSPSLNVIAIIEVAYVIMKNELDLKTLINMKKDQWETVFDFLDELRRVRIF